MARKTKSLPKMVDGLFLPVEKTYRIMQGIAKKTQDRMPLLYDEIEKIIKSHLVILDHDEKLIHNPDIGSFGDIIAKNIAKKLPNLKEEQVNQIIQDRSSKSFLDMLTRGLGNGENEREYTKVSQEKLFKRILIANRGEIALRIMRACRELHIETIVIYTKQDEDALAVKFADKSYCVGSQAKDYLNYKKIVKIAKKAKADAIHPGYGFLSENPEFARLCEKSKIEFIGPSSESIDLMGNKEMARQTIKKIKIPLLEGSSILKSVDDAKTQAKRIGYPVIIKAVSGGGGKGMRIIKKESELENAFNSAQSEAESSFGDKNLYMEKYLEEPSHIEFQVLADKYNNAIHLGERDCSIQRRHQKLVEEAPSPALNEKLRKTMGEMAVKIVHAAKYEGAGTIEFLLDKGNFYFMEMNTRIQVEHGITEMITGVDLIKEQIKIAAGAKLAYKQSDITMEGWAIECRINAECPAEGFCPKTGTISNYLPPGGPGIRVCSSAHTGHVVTPHYDSMIAKLMVKGTDRNDAISIMRRALEEFIIEGIDTTVPFHKTVLESKEFSKGHISTSFIDKYKIMDKLKINSGAKKLSKKEKMLIISTAVSHYLEERSVQPTSAWSRSHRSENLDVYESQVR